MSNIKILHKLWMILLFSFLTTLMLTAVTLFILRDQMIEDRFSKLRAVTEVTQGLALSLNNSVTADKLSREEAMKQFREHLYAMWYDGRKSYVAAASMDGVMLVNPAVPALEGKNLMGLKDATGQLIIAPQIELMKQQTDARFKFYFPKPGGTEPLPKINYLTRIEPWNIWIATGVYIDDLEADFLSVVARVAALAALLLVVTAAILILIARNITRPLDRIKSQMTALANGDLATEIPETRRRDEIGQMTKTLIHFQTQIIEGERLRAAQDAEQQLKMERAEQVSQSVQRFEQEISALLTHVNKAAVDMEATAGVMASTSVQTSHQSNDVAAAADQATQGVQMVATAASQLSTSISDIGQNVVVSTQLIERAVEQTTGSEQQVRALAEAAEKIGAVVQLIADIAGQTNLLALNATIEAARAGDAGKGFAVVASEVKALASQTARATDDITAQVTAIQSATQSSAQAIRQVAETILEVNASTAVISGAVHDQGGATQEIARNAEQVARNTSNVSNTVKEVSLAAEQLKSAADSVLNAAARLRENGDTLDAQVKVFLRDVRAA